MGVSCLRISETSLVKRHGLGGALCPLWLPGTPNLSRLRAMSHKTPCQRFFHPHYMKPKSQRSRRRRLTIASLRAQKQNHFCIRFRNGSPRLRNLPASNPPKYQLNRFQASEPDHRQLYCEVYRLLHWPRPGTINRHPLSRKVNNPHFRLKTWAMTRKSRASTAMTFWTRGSAYDLVSKRAPSFSNSKIQATPGVLMVQVFPDR